MVMIARVYTGVHWATDVLASLIVGMTAGKLIRIYSRFVYAITRNLLALFRFGSYVHNKKESSEQRM
jgi:undecaprenyl-diphosphatase